MKVIKKEKESKALLEDQNTKSQYIVSLLKQPSPCAESQATRYAGFVRGAHARGDIEQSRGGTEADSAYYSAYSKLDSYHDNTIDTGRHGNIAVNANDHTNINVENGVEERHLADQQALVPRRLV